MGWLKADMKARARRLAYYVGMGPPESSTNSTESGWNPKRLDHDAARQEQRLYWGQKNVAERLAASTELTRQLYRMRGIDIDEFKANLTPRRIRRSRG